jgi:Rod binding domain-containing protein
MPIDGVSAGHPFGALSALGPEPLRPEQEQAKLDALRKVAIDFEAVFLAQMLDHAGLGRTPEAFGGGVGEDAFRSHLVAEQAKTMAHQGGIGLAESLFESLARSAGLEP